jgi:DNA polymerase-3 subunit beta
LVATDGRRLALTALETEITEDNTGSLILPAKTVAELERLLGKGALVKIAFNDRQVAFEISIDADDSGLVDELYLVSKIVEGKYPNYRQVIPKETEHRVKVERELMLECVHRAALVTSDKSNSVRLKVSKNLLEISGSSSEYGESHESMAIAYDVPEVQVAFNPQYLMEPLKALTKDEVFFEFKDELSPGLFKTLDNFICVIMPLRLN